MNNNGNSAKGRLACDKVGGLRQFDQYEYQVYTIMLIEIIHTLSPWEWASPKFDIHHEKCIITSSIE